MRCTWMGMGMGDQTAISRRFAFSVQKQIAISLPRARVGRDEVLDQTEREKRPDVAVEEDVVEMGLRFVPGSVQGSGCRVRRPAHG